MQQLTGMDTIIATHKLYSSYPLTRYSRTHQRRCHISNDILETRIGTDVMHAHTHTRMHTVTYVLADIVSSHCPGQRRTVVICLVPVVVIVVYSAFDVLRQCVSSIGHRDVSVNKYYAYVHIEHLFTNVSCHHRVLIYRCIGY